MPSQKYFGKYRAVVVNLNDPLRLGRIQAKVPDISNQPLSWAMPCVPVAGPQMGLYFLPPVGADVWVEFEAGDPDRPIWVGGFWPSAAEVPAAAGTAVSASAIMVLQTSLGNAVTISDLPGPGGGIVLKSATGASIAVGDAGIFIANAKGASIALVGPPGQCQQRRARNRLGRRGRMASFVLHLGAIESCAHGGVAMPLAPNPRVLVGGQPVVTMADGYAVDHCPLPPPPAGNGPRVTGRFITASTRVRMAGSPLVLEGGASVCAPTGAPLLVTATQMRVSAA